MEEMTNDVLIPANRAKNGEMIRKNQAHLMHVLLERVDYSPLDPDVQTKVSRIRTFTPSEFERFEKMRFDRISIDWVKAAGFKTAYVLHDGKLIDQKLRDEINAYWDVKLHKPKTDSAMDLKKMAEEIKILKRRTHSNYH